MPQIVAPSHGECFGTLAVAVGLTVDEFSPVSARVAGVKAGGWRWHVGSPCQWLSVQNEFSVFQIWMNIDSFCYFCVELFRVPKIIKVFVWPLCDVYYLRKIWNVVFQYFLNVIKIAQLINKWVSMIFLGLFMYPKIMKIVLPLSYHVMNITKKFRSIGTSWFIS